MFDCLQLLTVITLDQQATVLLGRTAWLVGVLRAKAHSLLLAALFLAGDGDQRCVLVFGAVGRQSCSAALCFVIVFAVSPERQRPLDADACALPMSIVGLAQLLF